MKDNPKCKKDITMEHSEDQEISAIERLAALDQTGHNIESALGVSPLFIVDTGT